MRCACGTSTWHSALLALALTIYGALRAAAALAGETATGDSPRATPTVRLVAQCAPAVVSLRTYLPSDRPGVEVVGAGSGSIVHEAGYVLTSAHVVKTALRTEALLADGRALPARTVAISTGEDLALLKIDAGAPLPRLPLGRSHDLLLGEPTLVIGNPDGLVQSVSTGIVSGLNRATATQDGFLPAVVQTTAAINGGNSGGPVINALGEQIGVVCSKKNDADNIGFAVAVDRVRGALAALVAAEQRLGFRLGIEVDPLAPAAAVTGVRPDWPAAAAGIRSGDTICKLGDATVRDAVDFHLALCERHAGEAIAVELVRDGQSLIVPVSLADWPLRAPAVPPAVLPGVAFAAYRGQWNRLPDFAALAPVATGCTDRISLAAWSGGGDGFALSFAGFVRVPADGLYTFATRSDDGSRLWIGDELIVDNDGLHATAEATGMIRLAAGMHPLRVAFFEAAGDESLAVLVEGPGLARQELSPGMLFAEPSP